MPGKNVLKIYFPGAFYHAYNRGVDKRTIFEDEQDFKVFLHYLKTYLTPPNSPIPKLDTTYQEVDLIAYCLMPNHYHLLLKQKTREGMTKLIRRVGTGYAVYFNKKYSRSGTLFEGRYKAVLVETEPQLLHLSRYVHLNPLDLERKGKDLSEYPYSSYSSYLGKWKNPWVKPEVVLSNFLNVRKSDNRLKTFLSYQSFVEGFKEDSKKSLGDLALD